MDTPPAPDKTCDAQPLVSVIVRSMARPTLPASLASAAAQDYESVEIVVVAAVGPSHPPLHRIAVAREVRLVESPAALRRAAAANAGLAAARGDWIVFLDDDDVFLPGHLSGLMAGSAQSPDAGVIHCYGRSVFADGSPPCTLGQPHATMELFERNYIHLSTALFSRDLAERGCRFDESLEILEDWDLVLQLAQRTRFHFVPQQSFVWRADQGSSGAGGGSNYDAALFTQFRQRILEKWSAVRKALAQSVKELLAQAERHAARGDWEGAQECCRIALQASQNDPQVLNHLGGVRQRAGDVAGARAALETACAVRPRDVALLHNLAVLSATQGDFARAGACVEAALMIDGAFEPALRLQAELRRHAQASGGS